ncbi:MAG: phosphatase PAP2 family protein [Acidimicrobiales bacterium]
MATRRMTLAEQEPVIPGHRWGKAREVLFPPLLPGPGQHDRRPPWYLEAAVIVWLTWAYDFVSSLPALRQKAALAHGWAILHLEQFLHLDPERALNHWLAGHATLGLWMGNYYDNAHFVVTFGVIGWLWWFHPREYRPVRTALVLINVAAFAIFWLYPVAPPRLLPNAGFVDVVAVTHAFGAWHGGVLANVANEFAAMPSLHLAWACWSSFAVFRIFRRRRWIWLVWVYPCVTTWAVMATANHYLLDAVAGAVTMVLGILAGDAVQRFWDRRHERALLPAS